MEIGETAFGVTVGQEITLLGFRSLENVLERFQPGLAGFLQVAADHRRAAERPIARSHNRTVGLARNEVAKRLGHFHRQGLDGFFAVLCA